MDLIGAADSRAEDALVSEIAWAIQVGGAERD